MSIMIRVEVVANDNIENTFWELHYLSQKLLCMLSVDINDIQMIITPSQSVTSLLAEYRIRNENREAAITPAARPTSAFCDQDSDAIRLVETPQ